MENGDIYHYVYGLHGNNRLLSTDFLSPFGPPQTSFGHLQNIPLDPPLKTEVCGLTWPRRLVHFRCAAPLLGPGRVEFSARTLSHTQINGTHTRAHALTVRITDALTVRTPAPTQRSHSPPVDCRATGARPGARSRPTGAPRLPTPGVPPMAHPARSPAASYFNATQQILGRRIYTSCLCKKGYNLQCLCNENGYYYLFIKLHGLSFSDMGCCIYYRLCYLDGCLLL